MSYYDDLPPAGMVTLKRGDIVRHDRAPHIVVMVNDCRARIEPLTRKHFSSVTRFGKVIDFDAPGRAVNIARNVEPADIIERRGEAGVQDFLSGGRRNKQQTTKETQMKNTPKDKTKMRGGLAAEKAQDEAENPTAKAAAKAGIKTKGGLGDVMGFAVTSVIRRLGKEGCSPAHVLAILQANKIKPSKATVQIQTAAGKKGERGEPAPLTKAQVDELIASAPEPKAEPKAEPKKKGGKKGGAKAKTEAKTEAAATPAA